MTIEHLENTLKKLDSLKTGADKAHPYKLFVLLLNVIKYGGETQGFYAGLLGYNFQAINRHTNTLIKLGFVSYGKDQKQKYKPARTLVATDRALIFVNKLLKKE